MARGRKGGAMANATHKPAGAPGETRPDAKLTPPPAEAPAAVSEPAPKAAKVAGPLPHEPSGEECTLAHADGEGPCQRCTHCRVKHRPSQMKQPCPARAAG